MTIANCHAKPVCFYLYRLRDVALYVTLFALGHTITLIGGVLGEVRVNPYAIDAIIGFSVAYKALDNIGAWKRWFGVQGLRRRNQSLRKREPAF